MARQIQVSQSDANAAKGRIISKANTWMGNISVLEKEVETMAGWFKGETGTALIGLYKKCQKEIKKDIENFIAEYNQTIDKSVSALQDADSQVASSINKI